MARNESRRLHEQWLLELTALPTAAGREDRVIDWIRRWVAEREHLRMRRDRAGNLVITRRPPASGRRRSGRPIFVTAHLDHPAFVLRRVLDERTLELEFRGGVHDAYFDAAPIEVFDRDDVAHRATIEALRPKAKPFKRVVARLQRRAPTLAPGDIGRWRLRGPLPRIEKGVLHTHACDDLAAVAAALATLDIAHRRRSRANLGVLLTRAEEIGFVGAIAACRLGSVSKRARLICLENSRSFADSPIGAGPILRVGDRLSVFSPELTNRIGAILTAHAARTPGFAWQRKLMAGGACEATAFSSFGFESTCVCLPLGNYHNMSAIDRVLAGRRPARVGPEMIGVDDYHGMIELLAVCTARLDGAALPSISTRMNGLLDRHGSLVGFPGS